MNAVLMNPPYSAKWSANKNFLGDTRFSEYRVLAPKSKADFAFLLHGYHQLDENGTMAIVLPHGVLFRGNAEGKIRKALLDKGAITAVIGLPANIFFNTSIPTVVIILEKNHENKDVFFIDAGKCFEKGKNQNILTDDHIREIYEIYIRREEREKFSHVASYDEIIENDYNLNIPRYVDSFEEEEPIDIVSLVAEMIEIDKQIEETESELLSQVSQLTAQTDEGHLAIAATKRLFSHKKNGQMTLL